MCRQPFHGRFLDVRRDGRAVCHGCLVRQDIELRPRPARGTRDPLLAGGWRHTFARVALQPQLAFAQHWDGPVWPAVRNGILWTTLGMAATLGWTYVLQYDQLLEALAATQSADLPPHLLPWMPWLALPFGIALRTALGIGLLHIGLRLAGAPPDSLPSHARAFSLASITMLLRVIPVLGPVLATLSGMMALLVWVRRRYDLAPWRTFLLLLPLFLLLSIFDVTPLGAAR